VRDALTDIERLLRDYGRNYEANLAAIAAARFEQDPRAGCRLLNDAEWWNDRDAVCAIDLAVEGGFSPEARRDGRRFRVALVEVFTTMIAYGERNAPGELVVSQMRKWLESRI
jgi:hypothetical protein